MATEQPTGAFTGRLWQSIEPIRRAILCHPFLLGLADGSLALERFKFYVLQDALYLREFARALAIAAATAPDGDGTAMLASHASEVIKAELQLHEGFIRSFGLTAKQLEEIDMAPTNVAYCSYLIATASLEPFHEALGALLPCYWIYWHVGSELEQRGSPEPLYAKWIETYASEAFGDVVRSVIELTERTAGPLGEREQRAVARRFLTSTRFEWMFWDMAWRLEAWPV